MLYLKFVLIAMLSYRPTFRLIIDRLHEIFVFAERRFLWPERGRRRIK